MTHLDRRSVLAAFGTGVTATLAGCGLLGGDDVRTFPSAEVRSILSASVPDLAEPVPVSPDESAVRRSLNRIDELLAVVPSDLDASDVPNGVVRRRVRRLHRNALEERTELSNAENGYRVLERTPRVTRDAAEAAYAFRAATDDVRLDEVRTRRRAVASEVRNAFSSFEYVGNDLDRALYVGAELESELRSARNVLDYPFRVTDPSALEVGKLGGRVEYGRATHSMVAHLAARHRARLSDVRSLGGTFERALARSVGAGADRELPDRETEPADVVARDVSGTPAEEVLIQGLANLASAPEQLRDARSAGLFAVGLREAYEFERDVRAYESIRTRIADGGLLSLDVDSVRQSRERALELVSSNPVDPSAPTIPADMTVHLIEVVRDVDDQLRRAVESSESVVAPALQDLYAKYVWTAERLAALPDAVSAMEARFEA